jgi:trehalose 6-phosphate synthase
MAEAIRLAIEMPAEERRARMARMRQSVREQNIYRWAGLLLSELRRIPDDALGAHGAAVGPREGQA